MKRCSFLGVADESLMPKWAAERLEQMRSEQGQTQDDVQEIVAIETVTSLGG